MVIVLERSISDGDKERVRAYLAARGFQVREIVGEQETILGAVGIVPVDVREVELLPGVARVIPITSPYKLASREFHRDIVAHRALRDHQNPFRAALCNFADHCGS